MSHKLVTVTLYKRHLGSLMGTGNLFHSVLSTYQAQTVSRRLGKPSCIISLLSRCSIGLPFLFWRSIMPRNISLSIPVLCSHHLFSDQNVTGCASASDESGSSKENNNDNTNIYYSASIPWDPGSNAQ